MELFSAKPNIDFIGKRYIFGTLSVLLVAFSIWAWLSLGEGKYGIDFAGGTDLIVSFKEPLKIGDVRSALEKGGIGGATVQQFNQREFSIRVRAERKAETGKVITTALRAVENNPVSILKEEYVGPVIGEQIRRDGLKAFILSLIGILLYVSFRFELSFAVGAVAALFHDAIVAAGLYVFNGYEVSAAMLAAVLTIIGFSVNDTIIIFDRVRENLTLAYKGDGDRRKKGSKDPSDISRMSLAEILNLSINQTLSRTLLTNATAFFTSAMLWTFGGGALAELGFAFTIGVVVGSYSTIYIASPVVLLFERLRGRARTQAA